MGSEVVEEDNADGTTLVARVVADRTVTSDDDAVPEDDVVVLEEGEQGFVAYNKFTPPDEVASDLLALLNLSDPEEDDAKRYGICGRGTKIQGYMEEADGEYALLADLDAERQAITPELQTLSEKVNQALNSHFQQARKSQPAGTELAYWLSPRGPQLVWVKPAPGRKFYALSGLGRTAGTPAARVTYGQAFLHVITLGMYRPASWP